MRELQSSGVTWLGEARQQPVAQRGVIAGHATVLFVTFLQVGEARRRSGINTDGVVTMVLADTGSGLSFMALVDDNTANAGASGIPDATLGMVSAVNSNASFYVNDPSSDIMFRVQEQVISNKRWWSALTIQIDIVVITALTRKQAVLN